VQPGRFWRLTGFSNTSFYKNLLSVGKIIAVFQNFHLGHPQIVLQNGRELIILEQKIQQPLPGTGQRKNEQLVLITGSADSWNPQTPLTEPVIPSETRKL
jgi:hypothetical protein